MRRVCAGLLSSLALLSGCVSAQVIGEIQNGRRELMYGDLKVALAYFQRAAELDPDYLLDLSILPEGVWTYLGRAYYATERLPDARRALERARSSHEQDNLAKLYLGLVLAREGERERGLKEIEAGLEGLHQWLDYIDQYHPDGRFWDPGRLLRSAIQRELSGLRGKEINWTQLIANGEWLGRQFEEEVAQAQRLKDLQTRIDDGDGKDN